jgi:hypothetical protein
MKLTYMSASEFPNIPKYGLIPIPRKWKIKYIDEPNWLCIWLLSLFVILWKDIFQ